MDGDPDRGFTLRQPGDWLYNVLPYIEQQALHDLGAGMTGTAKQTAAIPQVATPLAMEYCPSRRQVGITRISLTTSLAATSPATTSARPPMSGMDYGINAGGDVTNNFYTPGPSSLVQGDTPSYPWNNPVADKLSGVSYLRSQVTMASVTDGASNTYLIGEKYLDPDYYYNGEDAADNESSMSGYDNDNGRCAGAYSLGNGQTSYYTPMQDTPGYPDMYRWGSAMRPARGLYSVTARSALSAIRSIPKRTAGWRNRADGLPIDPTKY